MGHERVGHLPRSQRWKTVVANIHTSRDDPKMVAKIAADTLDHVRNRLDRVERDAGVIAAVEYIVALTREGSGGHVESVAVPDLSANPSVPRVVKGLSEWVAQHENSAEYAAIATRAAASTISEWSEIAKAQGTLFEGESTIGQRWHQAAAGAGFSEVARLFFARFTESYLNYFLDRAASADVSSIADRDLFASRLHGHVDLVSRHAFETSKITQSFAAGWYNKHARDSQPTTAQIRALLRLSFHKIREELRRESL